MLFQAFVAVGTPKRPYEVADVFRQFGEDYRAQYPLSYEQRQALRDILNCRTAALGGHVDACPECGGLRISYNPCNNRHCLKCGAFEKAQWLENRKAETLPITYFHVIFTTDHAINDLARANKRVVDREVPGNIGDFVGGVGVVGTLAYFASRSVRTPANLPKA